MEAENISITVCGDGGCGKSSLTLGLVRSTWVEQDYDPTIEDSYSVTRTIDGRNYHLALTDTAGQEEYRGLWAASNLKSDAFLLVYDITNAASLDALESFRDMLMMEEEQRADNGQVPPIMIVAGNKCDLQHLRTVSSSRGLEWARSARCGFMETSAKEMVNVEETFALIVRRVVEARRLNSANGSPLTATHSYNNNNVISQKLNGSSIALPISNEHFMTTEPMTEKPVTTIDPAILRSRQKANMPWWRKLKCW